MFALVKGFLEDGKLVLHVVRMRLVCTLACVALYFGHRAYAKITAGRSAWFSRRVARVFLTLSRWLAPRPMIGAVDELTKACYGS